MGKRVFQKRHYLLDEHVLSWVRYPKENEALKTFFICTSADIVEASFLKYYEI